MMRIPTLVLVALLTAPVGAAEQQYTQEQQDSCGSILCLAGGGATPECSPYLKNTPKCKTLPLTATGKVTLLCPSHTKMSGHLPDRLCHTLPSMTASACRPIAR